MEEDSEDENDSEETDSEDEDDSEVIENKTCTCDGAQKPCISS